MSGVVRREQCPQCAGEGRDSSGDNLARYSDGHGYCHVCRYYEPAEGEKKVKVNRGYPVAEKSGTTVEQVVMASAIRALPERGISKAIAERYGVRVAVDEVTGDNSVHYYPYHKKGKLVGFKQRRLPKQFSSVGSMSDVGLFGQNLYEGEKRKLLLVAEGECFTGDTEIMTPDGWVRLDNYSGQQVLQYNEDGTSCFVDAIAYINKEYNGKLCYYKSGSYFSMMTPGHNMVRQTPKGHIVKQKAGETGNGHYTVPRVTQYVGGQGLSLSDDQIRLAVAVSADFTLRESGDIYGCFKKERKQERIKKLLDTLGFRYSANFDSRGYLSVFIHRGQDTEYLSKLFNMSWLALMTKEQAKVFYDELIYWDGNSVPNRVQWEYSSKEIHNATFVQTLSHLLGMVSTIIPRKNEFGEWFKVSILPNKTSSSVQKGYEEVQHNGRVYCVQVPSGMLLIRYKHSISVCGNCDALSIAEFLAQKGKDYAVVSIQSGADAEGTVKANIRSQAEFFASFEKVILCFDNDAPGITYANAVADWLCTMVKVGIMPVETFGEYKDVNDLLLNNKASLFWSAFAKTKAYEPDSIVRGDSISVEQLQQVPHKGYELPFDGLQNMLKGLRKGELTLATGGSGLGKTSVVKEICLDVALRNKATFGYMSLEESVEMAARSFVAMYHNVPVGRLTFNPSLLTNDQWEEARAALFTSGLFTFFDSSKFLDFDQLMNKVEFFAKGINCDFLVIDNLTLVSARSEDGDERKAIDKTMAALAGIAASTGIGIILVNHLKRQNNKSPNNGDMVEIQDLRGSGSLEAFSNNIIAVERNQQAEDEVQRNMTRIRVLKNRMFGKTGVACSVLYNPDTGRMAEPVNDF